MRVDFYGVHYPDNVDVVALLERCRKSSLNNRHLPLTTVASCRVQTDGGSGSFFNTREERKEYYHAIDLMRVRGSDDIPLRVPVDEEAQPFEREDEDGAGDNTAFMLVPALKILAVQRNIHGPSIATYARVVRHLAQQAGNNSFVMTYYPILNSGLRNTIDKLNTLRNIEVVIAPGLMAEEGGSFAGAARDSLDIVPESNRVSINISAAGLGADKIKKWFRRNFDRDPPKEGSNSVENIVITGTDADGKPFRESLQRLIVSRKFKFDPPWPQSNEWPVRSSRLKQAVGEFVSKRT